MGRGNSRPVPALGETVRMPGEERCARGVRADDHARAKLDRNGCLWLCWRWRRGNGRCRDVHGVFTAVCGTRCPAARLIYGREADVVNDVAQPLRAETFLWCR